MEKKLPHFLCYFLLGSALSLLICKTSSAQELKRSQGRPVTVSTTEAGDFQASYAADGNTNTRWSSQSNNYIQWLEVDLGATYDISKVVIRWADGRYATNLDVQIKVNAGDSYTTIRALDGNTNASANHIKGLKGNARYVRFYGRGRANGAGYRIAEFEVYGYQTTTAAQQVVLDTLTERLKNYHVDRTINSRDYANDATINDYISQIDANGKFTTLAYDSASKQWPEHAKRMRQMAVAYRNSNSGHENSVILRNKIRLGLNYYLVTGPYKHENWYEIEIGGPNNNMSAIILMKGAINEDSLRTFSAGILDYVDDPSHKGKNRSWVAMAPINKGCIEGRHYLVDRGFNSFVTSLTLAPAQGNEGIKGDNSFHQHHEQLQTGGYGKELMIDHVEFMRIAVGTTYMSVFTTTVRQLLSNIMLRGLQLQSYRGQIDFGNNGRSIAWYDGTMNMRAATIAKMKFNQQDSAVAYENWKNHTNGGVVPANYRGATHFWKSDFLSLRGANYYMSAKIISTRTYGTEALNNENRKGYNLPLGATNIMTRGTEYKDIYPIWDWSRIPGTTAEMDEAAASMAGIPYLIGTNAFGGGIAHNDEGVMSYDHNYRGVTAKKSYFFMDNMMLCLGKGITAQKSNLVVTSINQTFLSGDITYNRGTTTMFTGTSLTADDFNWIHHDSVGYIFPLGGYMTMQKATQTGTWRSIKLTNSNAGVSGNVFSAWFNHSSTPSNRSYCYIVAPSKTAANMPTAASGHGFVIVQNTTSIQAIRNDNGSSKRWAVVFHEPGTVDMGNGLTIVSDKKVIVFIKEYSGNYRISVSDPLQNQSTVALKINKQVEGGTYGNGFTTLNITFNSGDLAGKAKTGFFNKIQSGGQMAAPNQPIGLLSQENPNKQKQIIIYPNPVTDVINISGVEEGSTIEIYTLNGEKLLTSKKLSVNVGHFLPGNYVIYINENGIRTRRLWIRK